MNKNVKFILGVEFHVQLNSRLKLFSASENTLSHMENINISQYDVGVPGTFPKINMEAVEKAIIACKLFNCTINNKVIFDRKHYYYLDLPQSYQVTQQEHPIGINGTYVLLHNKVININNVHIETDAGKIKQYDNKIVINYDRCGAPLIEIVTDTSFSCEEEIVQMMQLLIRDLKLNNISNAHPEHGNIRADVNISYKTDSTRSVRYEIKNLNSARGIRRAVTLAKQLLLSRTDKHDLTLLYDDASNSFTDTRIKEDHLGYYYMYEPSLIPTCVQQYIHNSHNIQWSINLIKNIQDKIHNISDNILLTIINDDNIFKLVTYFYEHNINMLSEKSILFILDFQHEMKHIDNITLYIHIFIDAINMFIEKKANKVDIHITLRQILQEQNTNVNIVHIMTKNNMIRTEQSITEAEIINILNAEDNLISKIAKNNKLIHYAVGLVMKKNKGIKPDYVKQLLINIINKHNE